MRAAAGVGDRSRGSAARGGGPRGPGGAGEGRYGRRRGGEQGRGGVKMQKGAGGLAQYRSGGASAFILFFVRRPASLARFSKMAARRALAGV